MSILVSEYYYDYPNCSLNCVNLNTSMLSSSSCYKHVMFLKYFMFGRMNIDFFVYVVGLIWLLSMILTLLSQQGYVISYLQNRENFKRNDKGKNPRSWPIIGCQYEASSNFHRLHDWCHSFFSKDHRTVELKFFATRIYLTVDPTNVEYILKTNFHNYPKGERTREKLRDLLGDGIFNSDGRMWQIQRKLASTLFNGRSLKEFSLSTFQSEALTLLFTLKDASKHQQSLNIHDIFMGMTMNSIMKVGFGIQGGSPALCDSPMFVKAFDRANEIISTRFVNVWWKIHKFLRIGVEKILLNELQHINNFTSHLISACHQEMYQTTISQKQDLLSRLIQANGVPKNDKFLRDSILNFMIAGRDTTAITMSWFIYNVCQNKEIGDKIFKEVKEIIGPEECNPTFEGATNKLSFEAISKLHYLHAALTETLRLYPAVPRDTKVALKNDTLPDGTIIKAGDHVAFVPYSMGRMEFLWGSDVLEFKPERWLQDGIFKPTSPFHFTAFQGGPRTCIGKDWAYLQMKVTMALLLYFFEFELVPKQEVNYRMMMVLGMANGLKVIIHNRYK